MTCARSLKPGLRMRTLLVWLVFVLSDMHIRGRLTGNGDNIKTAARKRTKQALGLPSQNLMQGKLGAGKKAIKRKAQVAKISSPPGKKTKTSPQQKKLKEKFSFRK